MTTLYENRSLRQRDAHGPAGHAGYDGPVEIDTRVPPKARPVLDAISVNGVSISEAEILAEAQHHPAENPGAAVVKAAQAFVIRELLLQEAARLGIEAAPETDVAGRLETGEDATIRALLDREVEVPSADEDACRRFYDNNPGRFSSGTLYEARHILLAADPGNPAARLKARQTAERLIVRLREQPDAFAALASEYSACSSAAQGGNLGQLTPGSTVPEFERALEATGEDRLCDTPVETRFGYHVLRVDRRIPGRLLPFEMVKDRIGAWLEASCWSQAVAQYVAVLASEADIRGIDLTGADGVSAR